MEIIEKKDIQLASNGGLPRIEVKLVGLVESDYRLFLMTPTGHPLGRRAEEFAHGNLGDDPAANPDVFTVNFKDGSIKNVKDLDGCTVSALVSYAAPSDSSTAQVNLTVTLTQGGAPVTNGSATFSGSFTLIDSALVRLRLVA